MEEASYLGTGARERGREAAGLRLAAERRKAAAAGRAKERRRDAMACRGRGGERELAVEVRERRRGRVVFFRVLDLAI
jgi:hypothetical protein